MTYIVCRKCYINGNAKGVCNCPDVSESSVDRLVNCRVTIVVQGYNEIGRRWEDIRPPQDCETGERMSCNTLAEAQKIAALYDDSLTECGFGKMRIIERKTTDSIVGS
jgi:hypothetical protein